MKNILVGIFIVFFSYLLLHSIYSQIACLKIIEGIDEPATQTTPSTKSTQSSTDNKSKTPTTPTSKDDQDNQNNLENANNNVKTSDLQSPTPQSFNDGTSLVKNNPNPLPT
jgi:hypothetical protein